MAKSTREQMTCETPSTNSDNTIEAVMGNKRTRKSLFSDQVDANEVEQSARPCRAQQLLKRLDVISSGTKHDDVVQQEILAPLQTLRKSNVLINMRPLTKLQSCQEFSLDLLEEIAERYIFHIYIFLLANFPEIKKKLLFKK
ncbi:uncharacterized protein LOC130051510 [Ostrea edulis]|uniref:uncharacterized protein LOC130051510 n=1 Tax=Ostrea edulis TaxID=37623 RepID=UPI0024AFA588|nr:uncharacterized protein LOC130051510 [Ostrea edulis]